MPTGKTGGTTLSPPGLALMARFRAAQQRQQAGQNPGITPGALLHGALHGAHELFNPPPSTLDYQGKTYTVATPSFFTPATAAVTALAHAPQQLQQLRQQAPRVARGQTSQMDTLRFLLSGGFGLPRMQTRFQKQTAAGEQLGQQLAARAQAQRDIAQLTMPLHHDVTQMMKAKVVAPGYHGTNATFPNAWDQERPISWNTISAGHFSTGRQRTTGRTALEEAIQFARERAQDRGGPPHVVDATLALHKPLYPQEPYDALLHGRPLRDSLERHYGWGDIHGAEHYKMFPQSHYTDAQILDFATQELNRPQDVGEPTQTVGHVLGRLRKYYSQKEIDTMLRGAGYDSIASERQFGGMFNVRPLNYYETVMAPHLPAAAVTNMLRRSTALNRLVGYAQKNAPSSRLSAGQLRAIPKQLAGAQETMRRYKGAVDPHISYHGSQYVFDKFDPWKVSNESLYGPGFYTTADKHLANSYVDKEVGTVHPEVTRPVAGRHEMEQLLRENPSWRYLGHRQIDQHGIPLTSDFDESMLRTHAEEVERQRKNHETIGAPFTPPQLPFEAKFGDANIAPNVRLQTIITKKPFDVRNPATFHDKRAIMRALRDLYQTGAKRANMSVNRSNPRSTTRSLTVYSGMPGDVRKLLRITGSIYPPRATKDYPLRLKADMAAYHQAKSYFKADRADRREFGLAGQITQARKLDHIYNALVQHVNDQRLVNRVIRKAGYDAIRHTGGINLGGAHHEVTIALRPAQVRPGFELPRAHQIVEDAKKALEAHQGQGRFRSHAEMQDFMRHYLYESLSILLGGRRPGRVRSQADFDRPHDALQLLEKRFH